MASLRSVELCKYSVMSQTNSRFHGDMRIRDSTERCFSGFMVATQSISETCLERDFLNSLALSNAVFPVFRHK